MYVLYVTTYVRIHVCTYVRYVQYINSHYLYLCILTHTYVRTYILTCSTLDICICVCVCRIELPAPKRTLWNSHVLQSENYVHTYSTYVRILFQPGSLCLSVSEFKLLATDDWDYGMLVPLVVFLARIHRVRMCIYVRTHVCTCAPSKDTNDIHRSSTSLYRHEVVACSVQCLHRYRTSPLGCSAATHEHMMTSSGHVTWHHNFSL